MFTRNKRTPTVSEKKHDFSCLFIDWIIESSIISMDCGECRDSPWIFSYFFPIQFYGATSYKMTLKHQSNGMNFEEGLQGLREKVERSFDEALADRGERLAVDIFEDWPGENGNWAGNRISRWKDVKRLISLEQCHGFSYFIHCDSNLQLGCEMMWVGKKAGTD